MSHGVYIQNKSDRFVLGNFLGNFCFSSLVLLLNETEQV